MLKKMATLAAILMLFLCASCEQTEPKDEVISLESQTTAKVSDMAFLETRYDVKNDESYIFDPNSQLGEDDFTSGPLSGVYIRNGYVPLHQKDDQLYIVYSLADGGLCYAFVVNFPETGIQFAVDERVFIYPDTTQETLDSLYQRINDFDYPEVLWKTK